MTGGTDSKQVLILTFDTRTGAIDIKKAAQNMLSMRSNHRLVACKGYFYALGGLSKGEQLKSCERIRNTNLETGQWEQVRSMAVPRRDFACLTVFSNERILVFGQAGSSDNVAELYCPDSNSWQIVKLGGLNIPTDATSFASLSLPLTEFAASERYLIFATRPQRQTEVYELEGHRVKQ